MPLAREWNKAILPKHHHNQTCNKNWEEQVKRQQARWKGSKEHLMSNLETACRTLLFGLDWSFRCQCSQSFLWRLFLMRKPIATRGCNIRRSFAIDTSFTVEELDSVLRTSALSFHGICKNLHRLDPFLFDPLETKSSPGPLSNSSSSSSPPNLWLSS